MGVMQVSVVVTVYNERSNIRRLLASLAQQTRPPDEIVICDGGSTDGTADVIRGFVCAHGDNLPPLRLLVEPGANISRGRNLAIAAAHGPIIAVTDSGVRLSAGWLAP
jgi:glycosyltransferase involved in cell wall biosynthesis